MKIEEGRYYKTRDGRKVGPMKIRETWVSGCLDDKEKDIKVFKFDGTHGGPYLSRVKALDLISEWPSSEDGPIREVRRREIVSGNYGIVEVEQAKDQMVALSVKWDWRTPDELREAAHLFVQLAEVLEEQEGEGK